MPGIEPRLPRRQLLNDKFNRADANPIGGDWITEAGGGIQIVSNTIRGVTAAVDNAARLATLNPWTDQWVEVTLVSNSGSDDSGPQVRMQAGANSGYVLEIDPGGTNAIIYSVSAGAYTNILNVTATFVNGDRIRLEAQGSTLSAYQNDTLVGTVESTTWSNGWPGMHFFNNNTLWQWNNFYAGDYEYIIQPPNPPNVGQPVAGY